jgi:hypothetical protein
MGGAGDLPWLAAPPTGTALPIPPGKIFPKINKWEIPPAGPVTPVTPLQTLGLFDVPTGYIFVSRTETGYTPINTGVL